MKALILNSGLGSRLKIDYPKCMTKIFHEETILSRQLKQLIDVGIRDVVITTGAHADQLIEYCQNLDLPMNLQFVHNSEFASTNYIFSIYLAREFLNEDFLLMHGDLVFENEVLDKVLNSIDSCMVTSSTIPLPEKDFKAVIHDGKISKVGIEFFTDAVTAQPMYKLLRRDSKIWLDQIVKFCESDQKNCYAENALNEVSSECNIKPVDVRNLLCSEIDNPTDLAVVSTKLAEVNSRTVYIAFSTDVIHAGHISIIKKAQRFGKLIAGIVTDEVVSSYRKFPLMTCSERKTMFENIAGVYKVVEQDTLSYKKNLELLKPNYVVHGDDWQHGFQKPLRDEVVSILASYGGRLIEFPYSKDERLEKIENRSRIGISLPDIRRGRLRKLIEMKSLITAMEAHDGLTGLIVENSVVYQNGGAHQFDAIWCSSLCDSTSKGKPDIELVDLTSRIQTVNDLTEVSTKPIIFDCDTGGQTEHFVYSVRTLEKIGVSMVIIEDKTGLKKNSLFGTEVEQTQDSIENFSAKIRAGKSAQKSQDFMICARIESLILERGMNDALTRAFAFVEAGADAIMIHSRQKNPDEIFEFVEKFRAKDQSTYIVLVPTSYNSVTEEEFKNRGVNVVIYANHLIRAEVLAAQKTAESILKHHRSLECDSTLMPFKDIIRLIPGSE